MTTERALAALSVRRSEEELPELLHADVATRRDSAHVSNRRAGCATERRGARGARVAAAHAVNDTHEDPQVLAVWERKARRDPRHRTRPQILRGETPDAIRIPHGCRFHPRCPIAIAECKDVDPELARPAAARVSDQRAACIRV